MLTKNKSLAIVGGGPGGLTLARLLQLKGVNVKVYERDFNATARLAGSPLDMHEESGLAAIRKALGRPVDMRDTFIAGIALARRAALATRNTRHFDDLSIRVVNPWADGE